ncbi:hypothetical protein [Geothrix sp. SG200]|uniref:hypothetical protein n=1 Tax=Geothrix sp. SG200 TaxID=2922865 RepID=UPI001FAC3BFB|nr:hypothetical protein [Geothrix sp. SG200]
MIKRQISFANHGYQVDAPDPCPICHRHSEIEVTRADLIDSGKGVQVIYRCAYQNCRQFFFGYYSKIGDPTLIRTSPIKPNSSSFPECIIELSPLFISIFNESEEALQIGLTQIAGPGYRKSFEFLIKDYAISLAPEKAAEIKTKFSGAVVNDYIPDPRIQAVAKRSLWLGNDETHYLRKWESHDIDDLVNLIKLTTNWIEIDHLSKSYIKQMPEA